MQIKNILNKGRYKKSLNKDINIKIELNNNSNEFLISEYSKKINQYEIFEKERNLCKSYRLTITPNIIASNVLSQPITEVYDSNNNIITGNTRFSLLQSLNTGYTYNFGYDIFDNHFLRLNTFKTGNTVTDYDVFTITDMLSIQKSITNNLIDDNGWLCFYNKVKINDKKMVSWRQPNEKIDLFPNRDYFSFKPFTNNDNSLNYNWDYTITYPYKNEKESNLVTNNNGVNGLPIFIAETGFTNENGNYLKIQTPYKHGLNNGDIIRLKDSVFQTGKTYQIYSVGDINGENKNNVFLLDIDKYSDLKNISYINNIKNRRIVKYTNGVESEYYIRVFKKLSEEPISDVYKLGFAKNIFSDDLHQIQYIDDINISGLTDNLERPLSELYITFIKKNEMSDISGHNNVFGDLTSGFNELPGVTGFTNIRIINSNNLNELYLENNITVSGTSYGDNVFLGDIVEFNKYQVKEYVLDDVMYRFNLKNREKENEFWYHEFVTEINENTYNKSNTPIKMTTGGNIQKLGDYEWLFTGEQSNPNVVFRVSNVITSNGYWTVSFDLRGSQNGAHGMTVDICNYPAGIANTTIDNQYNRVSFTANVQNYSYGFYNFFDINLPVWVYYYIKNIKVEKGKTPSVWTPSLTEPSDILLTPNKIIVDQKNEGYFYKPHYKIPIKNFSNVKKQGELDIIYPCDVEPFISGVTESGSVVLLSTYIGSELEYLLLKINNIAEYNDYDRIRISKLNLNNEIIDNKTFNIRIFSNSTDNIAIPYDDIFFGDVDGLNNNTYLFNSYYSPDIPSNSISISEDKVFWRDTQPEGVFDENSTFTDEIPFTNNRLYLNRNLNLYVRRQDPFGYYGLKDRKFPSDIFGNEKIEYLNNNRYEKNNEIC